MSYSAPATPSLARPYDDDGSLRELPLRARLQSGGRRRLVRRLLVRADATALVVALVAAVAIAGHADSFTGRELLLGLVPLVVVLPVALGLTLAAGLHELDATRFGHSTADELASLTWLAMATGLGLYGIARVEDRQWATPGFLFSFVLVAAALLPTARAVARRIARANASHRQRAVVVGAGATARLVSRKLQHHRDYDVDVLGFVADDVEPAPGVAVLGRLSQLADIVDAHEVSRVLVADSTAADVQMLHRLRVAGVQVDVVPDLFELVGSCAHLHEVESLTLIGLQPALRSRPSALAKRTLDVTTAAVLLVLASPLFAAVAFRVKRDSPGPVFFRQTRVGKGMTPFTMLKFRTMWQETTDEAHRRYIEKSLTVVDPEVATGLYKLPQEDSITPVGRWLRKTSLDELPQLINVLRGEMSLVGPRPCIPYELEHFAPHHFHRFDVPAGMTGLWQTTARARATFSESLDMDVSYALARTMMLDAKLLLRTLRVVGRAGSTS